MESETKTVVLGNEWDETLRARLLGVLRAMGAELTDRQYEVGGSQELDTLEVLLDGARVVIEGETYIGLTLTGPGDLVERIRSRLLSP
jgi:hypothetical protein